MCNVHNTIGSLTALKKHLNKHKIYDFNSLKEVIDFQKSYAYNRQKLRSHHEIIIEQEQRILHTDLQELAKSIKNREFQIRNKLDGEIATLKKAVNASTTQIPSTNYQRLLNHLKKWYYKMNIFFKEATLNFRVKLTLRKLLSLRKGKNKRYNFITTNFDEAVNQSCKNTLAALDRKKAILDEVNPVIYGALGEHKVVKALESLSDEYYLINDFSISFSKPLYDSQQKSYIKSVQIDHVLISPAGIFLIETKNWNENTLRNVNMWSPVQQIKRSGFALFKILNNRRSLIHRTFRKHPWGNRKIPVKNLIVMTNSKPMEEFQFVKILGLYELINYIKYFNPIFSNDETNQISNYLLKINSKKKKISIRD